MIEEISSVMQVRNVKWNNTLSGNKNNMYHTFCTNHVGLGLIQATSTDNTGFFGNTINAVEIFAFIDDLCSAGYLLNTNKPLVIVHITYSSINPCSIVQRFLG